MNPKFKIGQTVYFMDWKKGKSGTIERIETVETSDFKSIKYGLGSLGPGDYRDPTILETDLFATPQELANHILNYLT